MSDPRRSHDSPPGRGDATLAAPTASGGRRHLGAWLTAFRPAPVPIDARERLRVVAGSMVGVLATALLCHLLGVSESLPWIVPPIAASAVLVFGLPASPLAQPWAVVGGNTLSALVGLACARWVVQVDVAAALAVGLAIGAMFALRCLHPPGAATALMMVVGGISDPRVALSPVLLNSLLLVVAGIAYNNATRRRYPHAQAANAESKTTEADLDSVLARYNQLLDVSRDDLQALLDETQLRGHERRLAETRCAAIMSSDVVSVEFGTALQDAWTLLRKHRIKALPVVDRSRRLVGILTLTDFLESAELDLHQGFGSRLRGLIRATTSSHSSKPEVAGQLMTRSIRVISADRHLSDLLPLFAHSGHHHIPVVDAERRLVGMITQSDVVRALVADAAPGIAS